SRVAMVCVGALAVTGSYQGWRETGGLDATIGTAYGRLLLAKLTLFGCLLVSAVFARRHVVRGSEQIGGLARVVGGEALLGIGVLTVTTFLVASPPAITGYAPPFVATVQARDADGQSIRLVLAVAPTRVGAQTLTLHAYYPDTGADLAFLSATGTLTRQNTSTGPVRVTFTPDGDGQAHASGVIVPSAGRWTLTTQVATDLTTDYSATTTYTVR
ncbi:MAG TPA: CopD family protein, partial [Kineosporiaceae bacterium]|nr:CopD family protein [Kineosporiaceae bacterium]